MIEAFLSVGLAVAVWAFALNLRRVRKELERRNR